MSVMEEEPGDIDSQKPGDSFLEEGSLHLPSADAMSSIQ
jgi:hypothetical protein